MFSNTLKFGILNLYVFWSDYMKFADELYVGKSIVDTASVVRLLNDGKTASGVFCICKKDSGKFLYEIMDSFELLKQRNRDKYTVYGIAAGKRESFELLRFILEDTNAY